MAVNKKIGGHAQGANDFLAPYAPTIGTATNVPSGRAFNNGRADVTFTPNAINAATSFTVTSSPGGYTGTGSASPITVTGLQSNTSYTFTVTGTNAAGTSTASAASNSITATTVPDTVGTPSVSTVAIGGASAQGSANTATDTVSWSAPADGGSAITNYHWTSSDGKSGDTASTSVAVSQESGTGQTYSVYATNANGNGGTGTSGSITSAFSFTPFSVFGFSPFSVFGFSPFGFSPFGVFGFSPFGVFGFSPFGFSPFGFSPFGFSPFGFSPRAYGVRCIDAETFIRIKPGTGTESTDSETGKVTLKNSNGEIIAKKAKDITVGDTVYSINYAEIDPSAPDYEVFAWTADSLTNTGGTETTIVDVEESVRSQSICFNQDESAQFTLEHPILVKKTVDGVSKYVFSMVAEIETGDSIFKYNPSTDSTEEVVVNSIDALTGSKVVYTFSAEPADLIVAGDIITHNK
jgi:hypothetical protein